jgi:hypothetical protein
MPRACIFRVGSALALALMLADCTHEGQFDPTEVFAADMFDTKKRLQGERKPVFPEGVPGAATGVPPDLVKGYQAPPEPQAAEADAAAPAPAPEPVKPKPKAKPRPKVARAPPAPPADDSVWNQKPATRIDIRRSAAPANPEPAQPAPQPQQAAQPSVWPDPPTAQKPQTVWPNPPAPGTFSR